MDKILKESLENTKRGQKNYKSQVIPRSHQLRSFIELGVRGHFPLFYPVWLTEYRDNSHGLKVTGKNRQTVKGIINRINKHKSIERKRTILLSLESKDRILFIHEFLKMVETKVLDQKPGIQ